MKVKIDIDTESSAGHEINAGSSGASALAADKIGLVSSIDLDQDLLNAFLVGADLDSVDFGKGAQANYDPDKIRLAKKNHVTGGCKVIAVVGGLVAFKAIADDTQNVRWLALVGNAPDPSSLGECRGGVSLDSYKIDLSRKDYLKARAPAGTYTDANIFLYTNKNSTMHSTEKSNWASDGTFFESAVGDGLGNNDATKFASDFTSGPLATTAVGLIVSDDPFFRSNRGELIKQVNGWLGGNSSRYVVYPSQIYAGGVDLGGTTQAPTSKRSTLYGPDLKSAYLLFGQLAKYCVDHKSVQFGFFTVPPVVVSL
jgi:hypothetical protein